MKYLLAILFVLFSIDSLALSAPKLTDRITIAASASLPPYVFSDDSTGLQLEILKSAFKSQGITNLEIVYMSNKRAEQLLEQRKIDVALNYAGGYSRGIYSSDSLLAYQNVAVSLKKNDYIINTIYDLTGKSVLAFQNATAFLPAPFKTITTRLQFYDEVVNQAAQVDNLLKEWVDVIVLEKRVFLYYFQQYQKKHALAQVITIHPIFKEAPRPAYFNSQVLQEVFDMGLTHIKENGEYRAIMAFEGSDYAQVVNPELIK
ncbi:transporter substrate-binding domain-containing protein [Pseudoalteromonas sp. NEC-BIFX-2020_002]|uniref:Transporter substrate-binding domain-containing protein n=2 Tax=Pseudoalteromonas TaxID=53246 RepID=A0ABU9U5F5_9GAMM|nr:MULTISPECIES: transporter substrate-binding domain-containing protein [Pseudoalteromonas]NMR27647.1 transporter substrate-binding domain-containing protein [Pseudoalteromonas sp. NEC-BIFX-2020_015]NNG41358.1 transporter substrate-binding domain-containing protein [Pseudoalteromonas sp. NEC-BIFX-2020_002]